MTGLSPAPAPRSDRPSNPARMAAGLLLAALFAAIPGCTDPEVGTIKPDDPATAAAAAGSNEGRFKSNAPAKAPSGKPAEEGIGSR